MSRGRQGVGGSSPGSQQAGMFGTIPDKNVLPCVSLGILLINASSRPGNSHRKRKIRK